MQVRAVRQRGCMRAGVCLLMWHTGVVRMFGGAACRSSVRRLMPPRPLPPMPATHCTPSAGLGMGRGGTGLGFANAREEEQKQREQAATAAAAAAAAAAVAALNAAAAVGKGGQPGQAGQQPETEESLAAAAAAEAARAGLTETDLSSFRYMRSKGYHQMIVQNAAKKFSRK